MGECKPLVGGGGGHAPVTYISPPTPEVGQCRLTLGCRIRFPGSRNPPESTRVSGIANPYIQVKLAELEQSVESLGREVQVEVDPG